MKVISISFDEGTTTITYQEPVDEGNPKAVQFRQLMVKNQFIEHHLPELREVLDDLLQDAQVALRDPPDRV